MSDGQRKIKEEAPDSSIPPFGTVAVRKSIDDVAPPGILKRKIKKEPSDSFPSFGIVAVGKEVQSIDDVAAPPGISKRKIKEEVIDDDDDDDQIIVLKKKKVVKVDIDRGNFSESQHNFQEHNFMLVNIEVQKKKTARKALKMLIEKASIRNSKFMGVQALLRMSNLCMVRISAVTDKNAQLIEKRIEEMRWHELFCIDNLQEANPFFWEWLEDEQIILAILLATYQQNLGTLPTKTLAQLLEDKNAIGQALDSEIVMRKLREKGFNKPARKILASIEKDMMEYIPNFMAQIVSTGDIQIQPSTKIVFNAPFHANRTHFINIINSSAHRIAYRIHISNQARLAIEHPNGVLDPEESVLVAVTCDVTALEHVADTVINDCINIEWVNKPDGGPKRYRRDWFVAPAISRDKDLPVEYNA